MAKTISTKTTKARKPGKGKPTKGKPAAKALDASTAKVKRSARKPAPTTQDMRSWLHGYNEGLCNHPCTPPKRVLEYPHSWLTKFTVKTDTFAWHSGYAEGAAQCRAMEVVQVVRKEKGGNDAVNWSQDPVLRAVGTWGASGAFEAGIRYALDQAKKGQPLIEG
jgi:hypothetical protein